MQVGFVPWKKKNREISYSNLHYANFSKPYKK
jgi:hypothetical protein